jgi:hypothetical protein
MARLFQLSESYRKLYEQVDEMLDNEEMTDDDLEMFIDTIKSIEDLIEVKIENINKLVKSWQADVDAYKKEEARLEKRRKALENRVKGLKQYAFEMLTNAKINKVEGIYGARLQKNPPSVLITNETLIASKYKEPQPDKILKSNIMEDLKLKIDVKGAEIAPETKHLRFL